MTVGAVAVTGAASGIGLAIARRLAAEGVRRFGLIDLDVTALSALKSELDRADVDVSTAAVDIADIDSFSSALQRVSSELGGIDLMINNAGIVAGDPAWPATPISRLRTVVSVNLIGVIVGTRVATELMVDRGGSIINVSSTAAHTLNRHEPAYAATKAGVTHFSLCCAEAADSTRVRVNVVEPGVTNTPLLNTTGDGTAPATWFSESDRSATMVSPEEVAAAVWKLAAGRDNGVVEVVARA